MIDQNFYYAGLKFTSPTFSCAMSNMLPAMTFVMAVICRYANSTKPNQLYILFYICYIYIYIYLLTKNLFKLLAVILIILLLFFLLCVTIICYNRKKNGKGGHEKSEVPGKSNRNSSDSGWGHVDDHIQRSDSRDGLVQACPTPEILCH